ncbi:MAG: arabinose ABC transporter permease [Burkholderiales bacterium PBB5]|nr:MAG: arabinose ABC transporter permease [Burkholderiales bacterium PBB5]
MAPFASRSFRFQWPADLCTAWALEMETLILGWYVLVQTGSVLLLTAFGALQFIGTLASPLLGTLADRVGLRRVLASMRFAYAALAGVILLLVASGQLSPWAVLGVAGVAGLLRPSDIGMRTALVGATVPPQHLMAAMGISRTSMDSAKVAGALVGAGVVAVFGMGVAYAGITLIHLAGALLTLRADSGRHQALPTPGQAVAKERLFELVFAGEVDVQPDAIEVVAYRLRTRLAATPARALVNLSAFPFTGGLMPYIARDIFHFDQRGLGWLVASFAGGALAGSLLMGAVGGRLRPGRTMMVACVLWYGCLFGFVATLQPALAMVLLAAAGAAQSISMLALSMLLLRSSDQRFRGRIMGVRMLAIYPLPLGLLIAGALIPRIGYGPTAYLVLGGGLLLALAIGLAWHAQLWRHDAPANLRAVPPA